MSDGSESPAPRSAAAGMHDRYGGPARLFFEWLFGPVEYPPPAVEAIRALAARGTLVYVARAETSLLGVYFNFALSRFNLPLARFVGGLSLLLYQPVDRLWKLWRRRLRVPAAWRESYGAAAPTRAEAALMEVTARGDASFLFLSRRGRGRRRFGRPNDYLRALIAAQRASTQPIFIVPHAIVSRVQSGAARGALGGRLFGSSRRSGRLRDLALIFAGRYATIRVADPLDLQAFVNEHATLDGLRMARHLAHALERRIRAEERVVAGPELPRFRVTRRRVLRHPLVREAIETLARVDGKSRPALVRRAERQVSEIAARYSTTYVSFLDRLMDWVFNRIYDGILVDREGLSQVLEASRHGAVIFCPAHRSHVDYLVLSYVLWRQGVAPPHIAAGANLSFFPLGPVFRGAGAFFLRRSFGDDPLYRAVFRAYVAELVHAGASIEFFIEGGRSRTGKLLLPKYGLLNMLVDAWRSGAREDLIFVPVSIDYERIIEAGSYERELSGADKQTEDFGALLRATRVLRSRYGRVHVQFGEPLSLAELAKRQGLPQSGEPVHDGAWRAESGRLGYRVLSGVAHVCTVTPTAVVATALLGHRGRGLAQRALLSLAGDILDYLDSAAARLSLTLLEPESREAAVLESIDRLVEEHLVSVDRAGRGDAEPIYRVLEERRLLLDYHKNGVMNYFAPAAVVARALARRDFAVVSYVDLHAESRFLSRLFKREFIYRVDEDFDGRFDEALATLAVRGLLDVRDDGMVAVREVAPMRLIANLLDSFVEAYWVTAQTLPLVKRFPLWDRELASRALEQARRAYLEGTISRPEAASRTLIESAISWFKEGGVLVSKAEGRRPRLEVAETFEGQTFEQLVTRIGSYL